LFHEVLSRLMTAHEAAGAHRTALTIALRLLGRDPLREDAHRLVMRSYCRLGQRNAALTQYGLCRKQVLADLGTEPMAETTELYREILAGHRIRHWTPHATHGATGRRGMRA